MKLLFDVSGVIIESCQAQFSIDKKVKPEIDLVRHIALNTILRFKNKLSYKIPKSKIEVVLCEDSKNYWRKDYFPFFKQHRKAIKEKSNFDWESFFIAFNTLKKEFKEYLPFKTIEVERAEADDIIYIISKYYHLEDDIIIISSDKDLLQTQLKFPTVHQYSPKLKKFITIETNEYSLFEHIVRGDTGDGIPNILSDDDTFINKEKRQKSLFKKDIDKWKEFQFEPERFCSSTEMLDRFNRNKTIIDMSYIPIEIENTILDEYKNCVPSSNKFYQYLIDNRCISILEQQLYF